MNEPKKKIIYFIGAGVLSLILTNLGSVIIKDFPEKPYLGIMTVFLAFLLLYFSSYIWQIKNNQDKIEQIEKENEKIREKIEMDEKILKTIKDIVILKKVGKIK